ncbi:radical SAM protein, partial [bacterium]|nr:radical SAM protein [candidate division CSSED10-310 bacterium]
MKLRTQAGIGAKLLYGHVTGRRIPVNVMISVTNHCPSRCAYCDIPLSTLPEMNTGELLLLLREIRRAGCERIALWGGEPLMRADIDEVVAYAKSIGLFVTMDSNGYLVPERMPVIRALDYLLLSLDGPERAHDANREPGSHAKCMKALDAALGQVPVMTLTVLTKNNLEHIDHLVDLAASRGFVATFQLLYHNEAQAGDTSGLLPDQAAYRR